MSTISIVQDIQQGRITGSSVPWPAGMTRVVASGLMSDDDATNTAHACGFGLEFDFGAGAWVPGPSNGWVGGIDTLHDRPNFPGQAAPFSDGAPPKAVRVWVDCPTPLSIGAQVDFTA